MLNLLYIMASCGQCFWKGKTDQFTLDNVKERFSSSLASNGPSPLAIEICLDFFKTYWKKGATIDKTLLSKGREGY